MELRVEYALRDVVLHLGSLSAATFDYGGPREIQVTLRYRPEPDESGEVEDRLPVIMCQASGTYEPDLTVARMFESLAAGRLPEGSDAFARPSGRGKPRRLHVVDEAGNIMPGEAVPLRNLPEALRAFAETCQRELRAAAVDTVQTLLWRTNAGGHHMPLLRASSFEWSLDGTAWHKTHTGSRIRLDLRKPPSVTAEVVAEVEQLLAAGSLSPLAHELLREAWSQRRDNPRSALVIAVAAAETGVKEFIANLVPQARWLATELPSPPLRKILKDYL
ncbi:MAG: hypothetical protein QME94_19950, partial [Anaerolineae bacterium]|nr:hypothetical protein [Anaerolineae bacterium]